MPHIKTIAAAHLGRAVQVRKMSIAGAMGSEPETENGWPCMQMAQPV